jgi:hypothetical protein
VVGYQCNSVTVACESPLICQYCHSIQNELVSWEFSATIPCSVAESSMPVFVGHTRCEQCELPTTHTRTGRFCPRIFYQGRGTAE